MLFAVLAFPATGEDFTNAIAAYLQYYVHAQVPHGCIVVGIVDKHGSSVISAGDLNNGTDRQANGDTLFNLESATLLFSDLLLEDMVEHGEIQPDEPVQKYLPASVKMPTYEGKQITVRHLVGEASGLLPYFGDLIVPDRTGDLSGSFTPEKFLAAISRCQLTEAPGTTHRHPSADSALLCETMALRAGTDIDSLKTSRIFAPLKMNDTRFTLTPGQESRMAPEQSASGYAIPGIHWEDFAPMAPQYSSANDLLKFLAACLNPSSRVLPLWDNTISNFVFNPQRLGMRYTGGGWSVDGCWFGIDKVRRRGVVVLANAYDTRRDLGMFLDEIDWQSARRPQSVKVSSQLCAAYAGQYERTPDYALGMFVLRYYILDKPGMLIVLRAALCLAALAVTLWCVGNTRKLLRPLAFVLLVCVILAPLLPLLLSHIFCARQHPRIGIRSEGDRLFAENLNPNFLSLEDWPLAQAGGAQSWGNTWRPIDVLFPPVPAELLAESETNFFERLSCVPMTFSRNANGKVNGLVLHYNGKDFRYDRVSDVAPKAPEPVKPPVFVKLSTNQLDACVGHYELTPGSVSHEGLKLTVWREGEQLLAQSQGDGHICLLGDFPLYPESETNFLQKITGDQFGFIRNAQGKVISVTHHSTGVTRWWFPDWEAVAEPPAAGHGPPVPLKNESYRTP